jgi:multidrug efflux pump subunit AcrA (membrane-fusion protein)
VGDTVFPGIAIVKIPDLSEIQVTLAVNEVDRHLIREGMRVRGHVEAYPDETFEGTVVRIGRLAVADPLDEHVRQFPVWVLLDGAGPRRKPGMTAVVTIALATIPDAIVVPAEAVFEVEGRPVVFPRRQWPDPQPVEVRAIDERWIAVRGLDADETLVVTPPASRGDVRPLGYEVTRRADEAAWEAERRRETSGADGDHHETEAAAEGART